MNTSLSLDSLASAINAAHERCQLAYKTVLDDAKSAGELLLQAKAQVPYGQWLDWVKENCAFSDRTCQMYMQIAKHWQDIKERSATVADLGVRAAIESIADKSAPEVINKKVTPLTVAAKPGATPKPVIKPGDRIKVTDEESPEYGQELEVSEIVQDAIALVKKGNESYPLLINQVKVLERIASPTLPDVKPNPAAQSFGGKLPPEISHSLERPSRNLSSLPPLDLEAQTKNNVATAYPMTSRTTQRSESTAASPVSSRAQRSKEVTVAALQDLLQRILDECEEYLPQELIDEAKELL